MLHPNRRLNAMLARYKARLGWARRPGPVLGVHVRRGDACAVWRRGRMHHAGARETDGERQREREREREGEGEGKKEREREREREREIDR